MSGPTLAWALALVVLGPPTLPADPDPVQPDPAGETEGGEGVAIEIRPDLPPPPPEIRAVPFPLEQSQPRPAPVSDARSPARRPSIVDLRDPFDRPPPRPLAAGERRASSLLLMPDLKDPFGPEARRVHSQTLDVHVPNDIRDPFRERPEAPPTAPCVQRTRDGTRVQVPVPGGAGDDVEPPAPPSPCRQPDPELDLRDPFGRTS